jgi:glutaredoxin
MSIKNTIIGADYCPYCVKAKEYFDEMKIPY